MRSRFYESSSSSSSDSADDLPTTKAEAKKTVGFLVLQARAAFGGKELDFVKLLNALLALSQKVKTLRHSNSDLKVACLRLCHQVQSVLQSEQFPQDRHSRRRVLSASQAKASLALQQKHELYISLILSHVDHITLPDEMYTASAKSTLDALERHLITSPLAAIPLELLNTFNLVSLSSATLCASRLTLPRVCLRDIIPYR